MPIDFEIPQLEIKRAMINRFRQAGYVAPEALLARTELEIQREVMEQGFRFLWSVSAVSNVEKRTTSAIGYCEVFASWWDHFKHDLKLRFPNALAGLRVRRVRREVPVSVTHDVGVRICPHVAVRDDVRHLEWVTYNGDMLKIF